MDSNRGINMGVYYSILCEEDKEFLELWKLYHTSYETSEYLRSGLIQTDVNGDILVDQKMKELLTKVNNSVINCYLDKHKDCKLILVLDWFDYDESWLEYDAQKELEVGINPRFAVDDDSDKDEDEI
jgi:hypothetical protein